MEVDEVEEEATVLMFDGRHDTLLPSRQIDDVLLSPQSFNSKDRLTGGGGHEGRRGGGRRRPMIAEPSLLR